MTHRKPTDYDPSTPLTRPRVMATAAIVFMLAVFLLVVIL